MLISILCYCIKYTSYILLISRIYYFYCDPFLDVSIIALYQSLGWNKSKTKKTHTIFIPRTRRMNVSRLNYKKNTEGYLLLNRFSKWLPSFTSCCRPWFCWCYRYFLMGKIRKYLMSLNRWSFGLTRWYTILGIVFKLLRTHKNQVQYDVYKRIDTKYVEGTEDCSHLWCDAMQIGRRTDTSEEPGASRLSWRQKQMLAPQNHIPQDYLCSPCWRTMNFKTGIFIYRVSQEERT